MGTERNKHANNNPTKRFMSKTSRIDLAPSTLTSEKRLEASGTQRQIAKIDALPEREVGGWGAMA